MRHFLSGLFCTVLMYSSFAQNKLDSLGRKTGLWTYYLETDSVFGQPTVTTMFYKDGKKNGVCSVKDRSEHVIAEINFLNNKKDGPSILYFKGKVEEISVFKYDSLILREYYEKGALSKTEYFVRMNEKEKKRTVCFFYKNGSKWIFREYINDVMLKEVYYKKNGKVRLKSDYSSP